MLASSSLARCPGTGTFPSHTQTVGLAMLYWGSHELGDKQSGVRVDHSQQPMGASSLRWETPGPQDWPSAADRPYFTTISHVLDPSHTPTYRCHHHSAAPRTQGDICPPRRPSRASFAVVGSSWGLQGPASISPSWLEKNFYKMLPCVPRSPATSPLHMSPESQIPQASPQSTLLFVTLSR